MNSPRKPIVRPWRAIAPPMPALYRVSPKTVDTTGTGRPSARPVSNCREAGLPHRDRLHFVRD
eukprot:scaffold290447_cov67-Attheya_sp.AAC.1